MSWVTVIWSLGAGACLTIALIQFTVWRNDPEARANLAISLGAFAVAALAALELALMHADTPQEFGRIVQWIHAPIWLIIVSMVAFVRLYLKAGRKWLGWAVVSVRTLSLILNFVLPPNLYYREITALRQIRFLGEQVSVAVGVANSWGLVAQLSSVLLLIFVTDATIKVWRRGDRKQATFVGGSIILVIIAGTLQGVLITRGIVLMPVTISLFYQGLIAAMSWELGHDVLKAATLTRRLHASETNLRESEQRMGLAARAAGLITWTWDISHDEVWLSPEDRAFFGFSPTEKLTAERILSVAHPEDRQVVSGLVKKSLVVDQELEVDYRVVLPDEKIRWFRRRGRVEFDENGKAICERGVLMDITERRQAENKFQLVVEASPSGIVLVDENGKIVLVNAQTEKMFGYNRDELTDKPAELLMPEPFSSPPSTNRASFLDEPRTRAMEAGRELFARRKDGSEFPVEIGLNPIQLEGGLLVLANVVDISARLASEEQIRCDREQVELLGRASLLGEMAASLAHELNQPLAAIMNNADAAIGYIEQGRLSEERLKEILTDVLGEGRRALKIVRDVRSAIKKGTAIHGAINLNDVIKSVIAVVQPHLAANHCRIEVSLAPNLPNIEGDPNQIQQVLINLVSNAIDAMDDTPAKSRVVHIATKSDETGMVSVAVRDHGCGIADSVRERLFEHFFTTKKDGLGMGLAIVRSIVELHGGKIGVDNAPDGGACFHFRLPIAKELSP